MKQLKYISKQAADKGSKSDESEGEKIENYQILTHRQMPISITYKQQPARIPMATAHTKQYRQ